jgi:hypothetical protein
MDNKILYKLLHFLLHEMNDNIEFFHNKYSTEFNQSFEEFNVKGETIKQYNIYRKYETMIEHDLEEFCKQEKYDSMEDLYHDIKNLVEHEKVEESDVDIPDDNLLASLFEPSANDVLDTILHLSSYTTFSTIMRHRAVADNNSSGDSSDEEEFDSSEDEESNQSDKEELDSSEESKSYDGKKENNGESYLPDLGKKLQINNYID